MTYARCIGEMKFFSFLPLLLFKLFLLRYPLVYVTNIINTIAFDSLFKGRLSNKVKINFYSVLYN